MISEGEIVTRILTAIRKEGQGILEDGVARNPDDIDVVMINAFGFPRWKGGPMGIVRQKLS